VGINVNLQIAPLTEIVSECPDPPTSVPRHFKGVLGKANGPERRVLMDASTPVGVRNAQWLHGFALDFLVT
jgi:hypothetical protein